MVNQVVAIHALVLILEQPFAEKGYRELSKYYKDIGMNHESNSIDALIKKKFSVKSPHINNEQRDDNRRND